MLSCKECDKRYVGCHSKCSEYILYSIKKKIRNHNKIAMGEMNREDKETHLRNKAIINKRF